jgi:hypothetical protein
VLQGQRFVNRKGNNNPSENSGRQSFGLTVSPIYPSTVQRGYANAGNSPHVGCGQVPTKQPCLTVADIAERVLLYLESYKEDREEYGRSPQCQVTRPILTTNLGRRASPVNRGECVDGGTCWVRGGGLAYKKALPSMA